MQTFKNNIGAVGSGDFENECSDNGERSLRQWRRIAVSGQMNVIARYE
jgi:hypothetical protein